ncbi:MAG: hypothetical protein JO159_05035 [Acidobacteria bacterium]|nr:hypothetical protein [Acidobacteriota bacterium]
MIDKETVSLEGVLRGEARQRLCRVKATRTINYPDECPDPLSVSYSRCDIVDSDDFPDGHYELEFDGHKLRLTKEGGQYQTEH